METIMDSKTLQETIRIIDNMYRLGWDERNGGNVSIIIDEEEVKKCFSLRHGKVFALGFDSSYLKGKYFLVTGTGKYFKNVSNNPTINLGLVRICDDGVTGEIVWGLEDGGLPTSEFPTHLMNHIERLKINKNHRVVIHSHPTHLVASTFVLPENEDEITRTFWRMITECIVVFPEGIGYVPWMVCGNTAIGRVTAEKIKQYRVVIWGMHGIFATGETIDEAFGLIETVEKAAEIYFLVKDSIRQTITNEQLISVANAFKLNYKKII